MTSAIARVALVPVLAEPTLRAEQTTQCVLGETAVVLETTGRWCRIETDYDHYRGWVHAGYLAEKDSAAWRRDAAGWSTGAIVQVGGLEVRIPLRARLELLGGRRVRFPDGRTGEVTSGAVDSAETVTAAARALAPEQWALEHFGGASYLWGGVTPWGVDCSGLVQTTFAARGVALPRDSSQQVACGEPVPPEQREPGDLLFYRGEEGPGISHVAFVGAGDTLVHSTIACGGVVHEPRLAGPRGEALEQRLVAVRRIEPRL